jgi:nicotinamidase-related amidase
MRLSVVLAAILTCGVPAFAQTIIDEWQSVKPPPAPELKPVTLDPKTTALLVLDLVKETCNGERRPRCIASIPKIAKFIADARAHGVMIVYTTIPNVPITDALPTVAPKGDEPVIAAAVDKFIFGNRDTGLEKMLKDNGITSVIPVGTAAHGAVLYTASAAALRGFDVILPVDGMSAENSYIEQYVVYNMISAPVIAPKITLTRIDMIKF